MTGRLGKGQVTGRLGKGQVTGQVRSKGQGHATR